MLLDFNPTDQMFSLWLVDTGWEEKRDATWRRTQS